MGVKSYRKKPVVVQAIQYLGQGREANCEEVMSFVGVSVVVTKGKELLIDTKEGKMHVSEGDYVIKGVAGEFYPCKPGIFKATYDEEV